MEGQDRYTISYRSTESCQVMDWIKAGQCGCIVGMRGAGKSNFLRFLLRNDVQQHYLEQNQVDFLFVLVNLLSLAECTSWGFYELILTSLLNQLHPPQIDSDALEEITALRQEVTRTRDTLTAQRAVEQGMAILGQSSARRLVLFFDEFDAVFRNLDPSLFRALRGIRDSHKGQISYIVVATRDLAGLREDVAEEVEHFYRLVSRNACGLGPYNDADSRQMLTYLSDQRSIKLNERDFAQSIELSGGHAGLLKSTASLLWDPKYDGNLDRLGRAINDEPMILRECHKVWNSFSEDEQAALCSLSRDEPVNQQMENWLKFRGILQKKSPPKLFSPVFRIFILRQAPPSTKGTWIRRSPRLVQIDGRRIETLTELEFETLCYLYEHREHICTKEDLILDIYRQQYSVRQGGLMDAMLQTLIARLREKIEPDRAHPRYVITVRGEGYRFIGPNHQ